MLPRGDGPFQVLERINENAYKLDLPGEYNVSATFNVTDLSLFEHADSRTNPFEEGGNDGQEKGSSLSSPHEPTRIPSGPITKAKARQLREAM